jgi:PAS domain S-box-containing protein
MAQQKKTFKKPIALSPEKTHLPYILLVEDEPTHVAIIRHTIQSANPNAVMKVVDSLKEYHIAIKKSLPELVLIDLHLPDGKAFEILTSPLEDGLFPIVVMTSSGDEKMAVKSMKAGAIDYIVKSTESYKAMPHIIEHALRDWNLIQEKKRADEASRKVLQEWQITFDATNDAMWILDKEQRILRSNKTAERIFQRTNEEFIGKYCWEIVHGTKQPIPECPVLRARKSLRRESMDLQIGKSWYEVIIDPILDTTGQYDGAVHIVSDITERRRAEEALRESEEKYRKIFENTADGIFQVTPEGSLISVNPALAYSLGYKSVEELLSTITDLKTQIYVNASERDTLRDLLQRDGFVNNFVVQCRKKDGGSVWIELNIRLVKDKNGKVLFHEGTGHDITERKRSENLLVEKEHLLSESQRIAHIGS